MKRNVLFLILLLIFSNVIASESLSFSGIPIEGSVTEYCYKLKMKGFSLLREEIDSQAFYGEFTGVPVTVWVSGSKSGQQIQNVAVFFEDEKGFFKFSSYVFNLYGYYKHLYSKKYGKPTRENENNLEKLVSTNTLIAELHKGKAFGSVWELDNGLIEIAIVKGAFPDVSLLMIRYFTAEGLRNRTNEHLNDI